MENYTKGKNIEEELDRNKLPYTDLPEGFLWMQVKGGSKMPNLIGHAAGLLEDKAVSVVVWSGAGVAIPKTISCAEIVKRQFQIPYQVTRLNYKTDQEFWEPKVDGLETLVVKRQIPVIHIMLSTDEIADTTQLGKRKIEGDNNINSNAKRPRLLEMNMTFQQAKITPLLLITNGVLLQQ